MAGLRVSEIVTLGGGTSYSQNIKFILKCKVRRPYGDATLLYCEFTGLLQEIIPTQ
jgi:hypothetical protein